VKEEIKMYVADVTDIRELEQLLSEAQVFLADSRSEAGREQAAWDIEDITNRIYEVKGS
jgi:hypothetical protein